MSDRPNLNKNLDEKTFRNYYYLKEELVDFCKENNLPLSGGKPELTERIAYFLRTGKILPTTKKQPRGNMHGDLSENTIIEPDIAYSENLRAFFNEKIGKGFSFNVAFQNWLKSNPDKTLGDAVDAYFLIAKTKKTEKTEIGKQFEYNTYIRDFFGDNPGKSLNDAIACWKYKKGLPGHNRYERGDLVALNKNV